jgi:hypothetical protein
MVTSIASEESPSLLLSDLSASSNEHYQHNHSNAAFSSTACSHQSATTMICPSLPSAIQFQSIDDVTVGSTATFNISNINMSRGMEDSAHQDHDEHPKATSNDDASVESQLKGQQLVNIQKLADNMDPRTKMTSDVMFIPNRQTTIIRF